MIQELPRHRHLGTPSIFEALAHSDVELDEEDFERVREAVHDLQEVLEANLRPRCEAGEDSVEEVYVAEEVYQRAIMPPASVRDRLFEQAGVTDPRVREAVQYTHRSEAERTGAYAGSKSKQMFVLVDKPNEFASPIET